MNRMTERERSLFCVQQTGFMTEDIGLFLNTHPDCGDAFCALKYYLDAERETREAYEKCYGPLRLEDVGKQGRYNWINGVWPWEMED